MIRRVLTAAAALVVAGAAAFVACEVQDPGDTEDAMTRHSEEQLRIGDRERSYLLDVPEDLPPGVPAPLIIALHGGWERPSWFAGRSGLVERAAAAGFVVAMPAGTRTSWNAGHCCGTALDDDVDDVGFIAEVLDDVARRVPVDPARVFVTGHSNGGMMAYRLACELGDRIAAIAVVSGSYVPGDCARRGGPVGLLHIHGLDDEVVPFAGGKEHPPGEAGVEAWARALGCAGPPAREERGAVTVTEYAGCPPAAPVRLMTLAGGGHDWPEADPDEAPDTSLDATEEIIEFFTEVAGARSGGTYPG